MTDEEPADLVEDVDRALLGSNPTYTREQVADRAGVPLEVAEELWQQLGFPHAADGDVAFTDADLEALERTKELISLGILTPDSQAALVRTWGRSFARLAEWQVGLLAGRAIEGDDPEERLAELMDVVLPNVEKLQAYIWRRHLASASNRLLGEASLGDVGATSSTAVVFVDIVGYTGQSKNLTDHELVDWVEYFEDEMTRPVVEHGGRVIKTIGDEILFVADDPVRRGRGRAAGDRARCRRGRPVPAGAGRGRVRRRGQPARRRVRPDRQHRVPAHVGGPAGHGPGGPRACTRCCPARSPRTPPRRRSRRRTPRPVGSASGGCRGRSVKGYSKLEPFVLRRAKER